MIDGIELKNILSRVGLRLIPQNMMKMVVTPLWMFLTPSLSQMIFYSTYFSVMNSQAHNSKNDHNNKIGQFFDNDIQFNLDICTFPFYFQVPIFGIEIQKEIILTTLQANLITRFPKITILLILSKNIRDTNNTHLQPTAVLYCC